MCLDCGKCSSAHICEFYFSFFSSCRTLVTNLRVKEKENRLLVLCHKRGLDLYTVRLQLPPDTHTPLLLSLLPIRRQRAAGITPPEPVTLFNDMSGQDVTEKTLAFIRACVGSVWLCGFLCVCACAASCKLQAIEWKSGILKALGK